MAMIKDYLDHVKLPYKRISVSGVPMNVKGRSFQRKNKEMAGFSNFIIGFPFLKLNKTLALELKKPKGGIQSDDQKEFSEWCKLMGWEYMLCTSYQGIRDFITINETYVTRTSEASYFEFRIRDSYFSEGGVRIKSLLKEKGFTFVDNFKLAHGGSI